MNNYHKNFILCGEIDFFCLLCEESFEGTSDVERHIRWLNHRKSIKKQNCYPKYRKDFIYKIGNSYYCEVCNYVMEPDAVSKHITEVEHKDHKSNPGKPGSVTTVSVTRDGKSLVSFPKLTIDKLHWHGIYNHSKCVLCQTDITDVDKHVKSTIHMIKIIQTKVIENAGIYYRQMKDKYYCFICTNDVKSPLSDHSCKIEITVETINAVESESISMESKLKDKIDSVPSVKEIQQFNEVNLENKTAKCLTCEDSVGLKYKMMSDHRMTHRDHGENELVRPKDHGKLRSELAKYGKQNHIKLNEGGSKGYCLLCDIYLSAHISVAMEHVNGVRHRGHLELKGYKPKQKHSQPEYKLEPLSKYMKQVFHSESFNVFCINKSFAVNALSFMFITSIENSPKQSKRKCFQCEMVLAHNICTDITKHWENKEHKEAFMATNVVLMEDEFIRLVRPDLFHCGFCNQVYPFWETMEKHLFSFGHKCAKKLNENLYDLAFESLLFNDVHLKMLCLGLV